jgi:Ca2+-binding RTX toxin-like protein
MRLTPVLLALAAVAVISPSTAGASTLLYTPRSDGTGVVLVNSDADEGHDVTVEWTAGGMVISDRDGTFRMVTGCERQDGSPHAVVCGPVSAITLNLANPAGHAIDERVRVDTLSTTAWIGGYVQIGMGSGDDIVDLSRADLQSAQVLAGAGDDDVRAARSGYTDISDEAGDDVLHGGAGQDSRTEFQAGPGADLYIGGPGEDFVNYQLHGKNIHATRDGKANDGRPGEHDDIGSGIDRVLGSPGADVITARRATGMELAGYAGDDLIVGGPGDDTLDPGLGGDSDADILRGGGGVDTVSYENRCPLQGCYGYEQGVHISEDGRANDGQPGEHDNIADDVEILEGTPMNDVIRGGPANNTLIGGAGNDRIYARRGGRDVVSCGAGYDLAVVDRSDQVGGDCEVVKVG